MITMCLSIDILKIEYLYHVIISLLSFDIKCYKRYKAKVKLITLLLMFFVSSYKEFLILLIQNRGSSNKETQCRVQISYVSDLLMLQLLKSVLPNLPYFFSTFHFDT